MNWQNQIIGRILKSNGIPFVYLIDATVDGQDPAPCGAPESVMKFHDIEIKPVFQHLGSI